MKLIYPKSKFTLNSPGYTGNLIVFVNDAEVYNKMRGDGMIESGSALNFLRRVSSFIANAKLWLYT